MTAREYLDRYRDAKRRADRLRREYEREHELIDSVRSTLGGDGMPHGSGVSKPVEDRAIRLADKAAEWKIAELDAIQERQRVFDLIRAIPGVEGDVLFERYVELHRWEEVCILVHLSWNGTHKAHRRALAIVQDELDKRGYGSVHSRPI